MIAPDANLLIYAYNTEAPQHAAALRWLEAILSGTEAVGIPMLAIAAFLRILTDKRWKGRTMSMREAAATIDSWLERPHVCVLHAGDRHWTILKRLAREANVTGAILTDVQLAAVAVEHGAIVYTADRDFERFSEVRSILPLRQRR